MDVRTPTQTRAQRGQARGRRRMPMFAVLALLACAALLGLSACGSGENIPEGASGALDEILTGTLPEGGGGIGGGDGLDPVAPPDEPPGELPPEEPPPAEELPAEEPPAEEPPAEPPPEEPPPEEPPPVEEPPVEEPPAEEPPAEEPPAEEPPAEEEPAAAAGETSEPEADESGVDPWVWVVVGLGVAALVVLVVGLTRRRGDEPEPRSLHDRQELLAAALGGWTAQGWAVESQGPTEAILVHGSDRRRFWVDEHGAVLQEVIPAEPPPTGEAGGGAVSEPPGPDDQSGQPPDTWPQR